jgi:hypothetical protein
MLPTQERDLIAHVIYADKASFREGAAEVPGNCL